MARDKERTTENYQTMEKHYIKQLSTLQEQMKSLEKERNLMMVSFSKVQQIHLIVESFFKTQPTKPHDNKFMQSTSNKPQDGDFMQSTATSPSLIVTIQRTASKRYDCDYSEHSKQTVWLWLFRAQQANRMIVTIQSTASKPYDCEFLQYPGNKPYDGEKQNEIKIKNNQPPIS